MIMKKYKVKQTRRYYDDSSYEEIIEAETEEEAEEKADDNE